MNDKTEEKKFDAHDVIFKHVFDNLRNVFVCATLALTGGAIYRYRSQLQLGDKFNAVLAFFVFLAAVALFAWNMVHGVNKFIQPFKGTKKKWLYLPHAVLYMLVIITIFEACILVQSEPWRKHETPPLTNNAILKTMPQTQGSP